MNNQGRAYIADLGLARVFSSSNSAWKSRDLTTLVGGTYWISPEMVSKEIIRTQLPYSDVFSLGLIILFCVDTIEFKKHKKLKHNEN